MIPPLPAPHAIYPPPPINVHMMLIIWLTGLVIVCVFAIYLWIEFPDNK